MVRSRLRTARALALVLLLVAGACRADEERSDPAIVDDGRSSSTTSQQLPEEPPDTMPGSDAPPGTDAGGLPTQPNSTAPPTTPSEPPPGTPGGAVPTEGEVGAFGPWYLRADTASSIVLEVRSQSGAEPSGATIDRIRSVLGQVSGKTVSTAGGSVSGGSRQWSPSDIRAEADRTGPAQRTDAAVLTLLFVRGGLAGAEQTIGVAVRSDVAAIFSDRVDEASGPLVGTARIEAAVTTHEVGHLLGLVDLVLQTGRADPDHPGHSSNRNSVMYFAVESTLVGDLLGGGPPVDFDESDMSDLRSIGGR